MTTATGARSRRTDWRGSPHIVQRRTLPSDIRALSPMTDPDDVDLTLVSGTSASATPEDWMRTAFEDEFRSRSGRLVLCGLLQLRLAPPVSADHLGGWTIAENGPERIRLEARGWMLESHLVLRVEPDGVSAATLVRYRHPIARLIWGRVTSPIHRGELVRLLGQAAQRLARRPAAPKPR